MPRQLLFMTLTTLAETYAPHRTFPDLEDWILHQLSQLYHDPDSFIRADNDKDSMFKLGESVILFVPSLQLFNITTASSEECVQEYGIHLSSFLEAQYGISDLRETPAALCFSHVDLQQMAAELTEEIQDGITGASVALTEQQRKKLAHWNKLNPGVADKAAERGTWIHGSVENYING